MKSHQSLYSFYRGQSLSEYLLIGSLIVLASLASMATVSNSLGEQITAIFTIFGSFGNKPVTSVLPLNGSTAANTHSSDTAQVLTGWNEAKAVAGADGLAPVTLQLNDGTVLRLEEMPVDPASIIETSGGSGYTEKLALALTQLAQQLEASKQVSPTQAGALYTLANQGHKIANLHKEITETINKASVYDRSNTTPSGKTILELASSLGSVMTGDSTNSLESFLAGNFDEHSINHSNGKEALALAKAYKAAEAEGMPLQVKTLVDQLTLQIFMGAEFVEAEVIGGSNPVNAAALAERVTRVSSAGICHSGNGTDTGTQCS